MRWINRLLELLSFKATPAPQATSTEAQKTIDLIGTYFETNGGLSGTLKRFEATGYVSRVRSWISTGPTADQFDRGNAAGGRATPDGRLPGGILAA